MISQNFACFVMIKYEKKYPNKSSLVNKHVYFHKVLLCCTKDFFGVVRTALGAFISLVFLVLKECVR